MCIEMCSGNTLLFLGGGDDGDAEGGGKRVGVKEGHKCVSALKKLIKTSELMMDMWVSVSLCGPR